MTGALRRPLRVVGHRLRFRDATVDDADFILSLRTDPVKGRYLSATPGDVELQRAWLTRYAVDPSQVYFIIIDASDRPVGTVRLYDVRGDSFSWGSWILVDDAPPSSAVESTCMVYAFGLACGFERSHFEVRQGNEKVWQYHERLGAQRTGSDAENFYYVMDRPAIEGVLDRYGARLPEGVRIRWA